MIYIRSEENLLYNRIKMIYAKLYLRNNIKNYIHRIAKFTFTLSEIKTKNKQNRGYMFVYNYGCICLKFTSGSLFWRENNSRSFEITLRHNDNISVIVSFELLSSLTARSTLKDPRHCLSDRDDS